MKENNSSITAYGIALARAIESSRDNKKRLFTDPYAKELIGTALYFPMRVFSGLIDHQMPGVFPFLVLRTRYIDDCVERGIENGIQQIVILGAGLDSRAYRMSKVINNMAVFEIDHPKTQGPKVQRIKKILGKIPPNVTFIPIDFEKESLWKLFEQGYKKDLKTLFIWEGVIYYLRESDINTTLSFISHNSAQNSMLVFDYIYKWGLGPNHPNGMSKFQRGSSVNGETFQYGVPEDGIEVLLRNNGFKEIKELSAQQLKELYFLPRERKERVAPFYGIAEAKN